MSSEMKKPCVVLGVTGGIAVYKACELLRLLQKRGIDVFVVMTQNACRFVAPLTFETLSGHPVAVDTFDRPQTWEVEHIALAKRADLFLLAPATANIMGKMACGIADDMLSTTVMATRAPVLVAPAMNTGMWENAAVQQNVKTLRARGVEIVAPVSGHLACGDNGAGKLEDVAVIAERACELLFAKKDMEGLRVMVTAGPSREALDPVRYISNRSSGKMGYAIAQAAQKRGAARKGAERDKINTFHYMRKWRNVKKDACRRAAKKHMKQARPPSRSVPLVCPVSAAAMRKIRTRPRNARSRATFLLQVLGF